AMNGLETIETPRLLLRRPTKADTEAIFGTYASDPEATRFLCWSRHRSLEDTRRFLDFSDSEWHRWPVGPYLIELRETKKLMGSTGLSFETPACASTGYVLAKAAWGKGYATETLRAIVEIAQQVEITRLYALCHTEHSTSRHVLEKCGFVCEETLPGHTEFPNLGVVGPCDVVRYARAIADRTGANGDRAW
ncbi:MAG: GNAT family N-acetyltransferase, partial [Thermosynechococcaceae cyanobacterium]